jgi:cysteinyl-tRNA synthetase
VLGDELELLGNHFDIHGGGQDLQFPHHENEIAQSEGANCCFVNYWMHNGFVRVDNEKMSKSLGNFFTIRTVLEQFDAEVVRFFILRAHYRSPLNYSDAHLDDAKRSLDSLYFTLRDVPPASVPSTGQRVRGSFRRRAERRFRFAWRHRRAVRTGGRGQSPEKCRAIRPAQGAGGVIGLLEREPMAYLQGGAGAGGLDDSHRADDRRSCGSQEGEEFRRSRPHPR